MRTKVLDGRTHTFHIPMDHTSEVQVLKTFRNIQGLYEIIIVFAVPTYDHTAYQKDTI